MPFLSCLQSLRFACHSFTCMLTKATQMYSKLVVFLMFSYLVFIYTFYGDFFCFCFSNFLCFTKSPWFRNMVSSTSPFLLSLHFFFGKNANLNQVFVLSKYSGLNKFKKKRILIHYIFFFERTILFVQSRALYFSFEKIRKYIFYCFDWIANIASFMASYSASA